MTERPDAAASEKTDDASWKVEGSSDGSSDTDAGLGDTVVQISKIGSSKSQPKPTMGRGASAASRRRPSTKKTTPSSQNSSGAPKPSIPKPSRPSPTEDLMAPFDKAAEANASEKAASAPKVPEQPAAAKPAAAKVDASPSPSPRTPAGKPQTWEQPKVVSSMAMPEPSATRPPAAEPAMPASRPGPGVARRTRKARLRLSRIDPWSVMKTVFLFSIAFGIMIWVAVYVLWWVLQMSGVFDVINQSIMGIISSPNNTEGFRIEDYISANKVLGVTALLGVINVIITTALGTLGAFLYNLSANILGGLELTLAED